MTAHVESLRSERDRFVAFAFASADLFLEVDEDGRIAFAAGAAQRLCGAPAQALCAQPFESLLHADDRPMAKTVLASIRRGGRFAPLLVRLAGHEQPPVVLGGCCLPDRNRHIFLSISTALRFPEGRRAGATLLPADKFLEAAKHCVSAAHDPHKMSLLDVKGLASLKQRLDTDLRDGLSGALQSQIRAVSANIAEVGEIAEGRYGVLHTDALDADELRQRVQEFGAGLDPAGLQLSLQAITLDLARGALSEADAVRALLHAVSQFARSDGAMPTLSSLQESLVSLVGASAQHVSLLRGAVSDGHFSIAVQPVVELATKTILHREALSRFGEGFSPGEIVLIAEEIGLIADFDLAVCRRVLELLGDPAQNATPIAANVSGRSWGSDAFVDALLRELAASPVPPAKLLFEITETAAIVDLARANNVAQDFRRRGYRLCLDDFGAGASSFHYLRGLDVDYVKIDGQFCRDALNQPRARALFNTVVTFCRQNRITSIGEMIETQHQAAALQKLGLELGQGYLFRKPEIVSPAASRASRQSQRRPNAATH